jgi:hypothetical protein
MNQELEMKLVTRYPTIFKYYKGDPKITCMAWGLDCGDGWFDLIQKACSDVMELCNKYHMSIVADQVKEKFGGLRFYFHFEVYNKTLFEKIEWKVRTFLFRHKLGKSYWKYEKSRRKFYRSPSEKVEDILSYAELTSLETCERCGVPGRRRPGGWIKTLCDKCWADKTISQTIMKEPMITPFI